MDQHETVNTLHIPEPMYRRLHAHLFPGDGDEHGAVIATGFAKTAGGWRFMARDLFLARDGIDYVPGKRGYRMLRAEFVYDRLRYCRDRGLAYFAVHNHGGTYSVQFSGDDLGSHERGYPALLDVMRGLPVGALVFAEHAVAADIWFPGGNRTALDETRIIGARLERLYDAPRSGHTAYSETYNRQVLLFGENGQELLRSGTVGIVGAGGVGSLVIEYLARLGVGRLLVADPDRMELSNLSRIVGARRSDTVSASAPSFLRKLTRRSASFKTAVSRRLVKEANPIIAFRAFNDNFAKESIAKKFLDCDFIFLAADSAQARLVFNAIVQQFYIPGIQIGSKVIPDKRQLADCYSVSRWVLPGSGCLWCNGFISREKLAWEAKTEKEQEEQRYGTDSVAPSVITMNAVGASQAVNDFLFFFLGLTNTGAPTHYRRYKHLSREALLETPRRDNDCSECGDGLNSRRAKGQAVDLPTISA